MKAMIRLVGVVSVGASLLVASTTFAGGIGGYYGGYRGGYGWHGGWGWGVYPAVAFGAALAYGWPYYYNYAPAYYYAPAPVVYSDQPQVVYNDQQPTASSSPTMNFGPQRPIQTPADYSSQVPAPAPASPPNVQYQPIQPNTQKQSMTVAEIKALVKGGLSDEVILSQIRNSQAVFHLTTEEILDLNNNKVSQKVIEFMINTASQH